MALKRTRCRPTTENLKKCKNEASEPCSNDETRIKKEVKGLQIKTEIKEEPEDFKNDLNESYHTIDIKNGLTKDISIIHEVDLHKMAWRKLACKPTELRLDIVLKCGQSFRWTTPFKSRPDEYVGVLESKVWILKQTPDSILYKTLQKENIKQESNSSFQETNLMHDKKDEEYLREYFQLDVDLESLYSVWGKVDPVFHNISKRFIGVRMLRQDPVENIFSFICSSNNNIKRISGMVENLCTRYGKEITKIQIDDSVDDASKVYYSFPTLQSLCGELPSSDNSMDVEQTLRSLSFGYRAAYIAKTAKQITNAGGYEYLLSLRALPYNKAKAELLKLTGIGPKVADCVLLMSLDKPSTVPVDIHMFQIAAKTYLPHLKGQKSVTDKVYKEISDHFRELYGDYAGWAHSVLFSADLRHLQNIEKPNDTQVKPPKTNNTKGRKRK